MKSIFFQKNTLSAVFGNSLEWYDFVLYGSLAPFISRNFFPTNNHLLSLIITFAVFAVGFLFRPLGGVIFSHFGDTKSRSSTLKASVILMVLPTILLGLVPTYDQIGVFCPLIVIFIRLFQGLAVGGEYAGSMTYLSEVGTKKDRGFNSSLVQVGLFFGIFIGPVVIKLTMYFVSSYDFMTWGWRIPFLFSAVLGVINYVLAKYLTDPVSFTKVLKKDEKDADKKEIPLVTCLKKYKKQIVVAFFLSVQVGIPFWIIMVYSVTYFSKILHAPFAAVETQNLFAILIAIVVSPISGKLTKFFSAWGIMLFSSICFMVLAFLVNVVLVDNVMMPVFYVAHFLMVAMTALYLGPFASFVASLFPTNIRFTGIAFSYNISLAIFGGFAPMVVTALIKGGVLLAPGILLTFSGVVAFVTLLFSRKLAKY